MACNRLNMGPLHLFSHPKCSRIIFGKTHFWTIFGLFLVPKQPIFKVLTKLIPNRPKPIIQEQLSATQFS